MRIYKYILLSALLLSIASPSYAAILFGEEVDDADLLVIDEYVPVLNSADNIMSGEVVIDESFDDNGFDDSAFLDDSSSLEPDVDLNSGYDEDFYSDATRVRTGPEMIVIMNLLIAMCGGLALQVKMKKD